MKVGTVAVAALLVLSVIGVARAFAASSPYGSNSTSGGQQTVDASGGTFDAIFPTTGSAMGAAGLPSSPGLTVTVTSQDLSTPDTGVGSPPAGPSGTTDTLFSYSVSFSSTVPASATNNVTPTVVFACSGSSPTVEFWTSSGWTKLADEFSNGVGVGGLVPLSDMTSGPLDFVCVP